MGDYCLCNSQNLLSVIGEEHYKNTTNISFKDFGWNIRGHSESLCLSIWHKNAFARIGPIREPIPTPSVCLYMTWSKMKSNSYAAKVKSSLMSLQYKLWIVLVSQSKSSIRISISSFKGILVNKLSTSRLAKKWLGQKLETSSGNENESCIQNALDVRGDKIGTKDFAT